MAGQLQPEHRRAYILGGKATVTLVSKRTGDRFTYRVQGKDVGSTGNQKTLHFVSVLTGPNNQEDYEFLGTIFEDGVYRHGGRSQIPRQAPSAKAWDWTWQHLLSTDVEVWHEGECSRCGRALTDPESIRIGLGPVCATR